MGEVLVEAGVCAAVVVAVIVFGRWEGRRRERTLDVIHGPYVETFEKFAGVQYDGEPYVHAWLGTWPIGEPGTYVPYDVVQRMLDDRPTLVDWEAEGWE